MTIETQAEAFVWPFGHDRVLVFNSNIVHVFLYTDRTIRIAKRGKFTY